METVSGVSNWKLVIRREERSVCILRAVTCDERAVLPEELFGLPVTELPTLHEAHTPIQELLEAGKIQYIISTSAKGRLPIRDSVQLRRKAVELGIPCLTSLDTAVALASSLESGYSEENISLVDMNHPKQTTPVTPGQEELPLSRNAHA